VLSPGIVVVCVRRARMASPEQPGGSVVCFSPWPSQHPGSAPRFVDRLTFDAYFIEAGSEFYRLKTVRQKPQRPPDCQQQARPSARHKAHQR